MNVVLLQVAFDIHNSKHNKNVVMRNDKLISFYPAVIWYFEPHGIFTSGSIFIHGILNPLIEN